MALPPLRPFISQCVLALQRTLAQVLNEGNSLVVVPKRVSERILLCGLIDAKYERVGLGPTESSLILSLPAELATVHLPFSGIVQGNAMQRTLGLTSEESTLAVYVPSA